MGIAVRSGGEQRKTPLHMVLYGVCELQQVPLQAQSDIYS